MVSAPVRWTALLTATAVSIAWLWRATDAAAPAPGVAVAAPVPAVVAAPPAAVPAPAVAPAMPYHYVGSWRDGDRLHLTLKRGGLTYNVSGLGALDDQYAVVAADDDQVSLRYLPLGTVQVLRKEYPQPAAATPPAQAATPRAVAGAKLSPSNDSEEN